MMKTATITFQNTNNFGAALQCYALQTTIKSLGAENEVLNYTSPYLNKSYKLSVLKEKGLVRYVLGMAYAMLRAPRNKAFARFRRLLKLSKPLDKQSISTVQDDYDLFISGSDQVWNGSLVGYDDTYFLGFVTDRAKKGSYAASFGFQNIPENLKAKYKELLGNYKYYNVREASGVEILKNLLNVDAHLTVDPTLLVDRSQWESILETPKVRGNYILVYQISPSSKLIEVVKRLKKEAGLQVVAVPFIMGPYFSYKPMPTIGPAEWVGLFANASFVVTDSFHGTAFSMIFNKNVWCCVPKTESRINGFLSLVGLTDRLLYPDTSIPTCLTGSIDFANVNKVLDEIRNQGKNTLNQMINGTE